MYEGRVGSGKTYELVTGVIIPNLRDKDFGMKILTNIPLRIHDIEAEYFHPGYLTNRVQKIDAEAFFELKNDPENFKNTMIIIDECHTFFWSHKSITDEVLLDFFAMHRHYLCHILLATQERSKVAAKVVKEVEYFHVCENFQSMGFGARYQYREFHGNSKTSNHRALRRYNKNNFKLYDSFDPSVAKDISKYRTPRKSGFNIWYFVAIFVGLYFASGYFLDKLNGSDSSESEVADVIEEVQVEEIIEEKVSGSQENDSLVLYTKSGPMTVSKDWRINGMVDLGDEKRYILKSPDGQIKVVWTVSDIKLPWNDPVKNQSKFPNRKF